MIKLPLLKPRQKKQTAKVNVYTHHMKQVNHRALVLIFCLILIIAAIIILLPLLQRYYQSSSNQGISSAATSSFTASKTVFTIKTRYNQECSFIEQIPTSFQFTATSANEIWFASQTCPGRVAIRVVSSKDFQDLYAKKVFPLASSITFLIYSDNVEEAELVDPLRYQTLLSQRLINTRLLFDPTRAFKTFTTNSEQFFLIGGCDQTNECSLWKQNRISGLSELITSFPPPSPRFATEQSLPTLLLLRPVTNDTTEIISIDTQNPSNIVRRAFRNSDPILEKYN